MLVRWVLLGLFLSPLLKATRPPRFGRKMSTMLSFDLRRKTKHHRERNTTTATESPAPTTASNDEEEMEFSLRVCLAKLRARYTNFKNLGSFCEYRSTDDAKQKKQKTENKTTLNKT